MIGTFLFSFSISSFRFQLLFHFHFICLANVVVCHKAIVSKLFGSQVCLPHQLQFFFLSLVHRSSITPTCARLAAYSMSSYCLKEMLSKAPPNSTASVKALLELLSLSLVKACIHMLASFPGFPSIQFLVTCSMQKRRGKAYRVNDVLST